MTWKRPPSYAGYCVYVFSPVFLSNGISSVAYVSLISFLLFSFTGCDSRLSREDYIEWVRDSRNNAHVLSSVDDFVFDLQYQPAEYVLIQRGADVLTEEARAEELRKISGLQYYTLVINTRSKTDPVAYGAGSEAERQQRLYYFSYRFQDDIVVEENGSELPCILYHFERPVGADGSRTFVLGFEHPGEPSDEAKVVIRSSLFSSLPVRIKVLKANIPHVDL